ncbi:MAG: iron-containing alcohol dehydrogenase [Candidatus Brockarchaeota archaeon]|nr:iron-containing alcohol dehydrogenase [Candidatus Brockarchaeota archaeon]
MKSFTLNLQTRIIFGRGCLSRLGGEAASLGDRCLLVTGRSFARESGYLKTLVEILSESGLKVTVFDKVEPNPSIGTVYKGAEEGSKNNCNLVVALGGGSAMDAAKGVAFLLKSNSKLEENLFPNEVNDALPLIAIPTTCGTGSEVTKYAVLTLVKNHAKRKVVLLGNPLLPKVSILDANLLNHLPKELVAYTGFDALSHALEAYTSKDSTPFSDLLGLEAVRIILENIIEAFRGSPEARENMLYASMLAGMAINFAGTEIVHAMGYYLTNYHNVHHGLANGMLLPHVLRMEIQKGFGKLEDAALRLGLVNGMELVKKIEELVDRVGIPRSLKDLGLEEDELDAMVADALSYERNVNKHPLPLTAEDLKMLFTTAFSGRRFQA